MLMGPSNITGRVDEAFVFIVACCIILLAGVTVCMIVFLIRYNRKRHPKPERVRQNVALEVVWTVVPLILVLIMFYVGWVDFSYIRNPPKDAMTVQVTARQWSWHFSYENGKQSDVLNVPLGRPVKLLMTSVDVLHSLFIPAYRIKEDLVPGMTTHLWFTANELGSYDIFCTEYCGLGHSHMRSTLVTMEPDAFREWLEAAPSPAAAEPGLALLQSKGCLGCHSLDGSPKVGPTFKALLGKQETLIIGGTETVITVDSAFIRSHILQPQAANVKGFPPVMPATPMTEEELDAVVSYLEKVK